MKIYVYLILVILAAMPYFSAVCENFFKKFQKPPKRMTHYAQISRAYTRQGLVPVPVKSRVTRR